MPRYYFDLKDGNSLKADEEGVELSDDDDARDQALEMLGDIIRYKHDESRELSITGCQADRRELFTATLSLQVKWHR